MLLAVVLAETSPSGNTVKAMASRSGHKLFFKEITRAILQGKSQFRDW